jgi:hypothetical protein
MFLVVTPFSSLEVHRRLVVTISGFCIVYFSILNMEGVHSSETSMNLPSYIPEDTILHSYSCENLNLKTPGHLETRLGFKHRTPRTQYYSIVAMALGGMGKLYLQFQIDRNNSNNIIILSGGP